MTFRNGESITGVVHDGTRGGGKSGKYDAVPLYSSGHGGNTPFLSAALFKNYGYYAAGLTWEVWFSTGAPSTSNPSGHTLTQVQNIEVV